MQLFDCPIREAFVFDDPHKIAAVEAGSFPVDQKAPEHGATAGVGSAAESVLRKEKLVFRTFEFILQSFRTEHQHLLRVLSVIGAGAVIEEPEILPCSPDLIKKQIREAGMGLHAEMPADVFLRNGKALCPGFVFLGKATVIGFLLL